MNSNRSLGPRLIVVATLLMVVVIGGTAGYVLLEGWTLMDAFYMTIITLSTVGFGEVRPLHPASQLFTAVLIFVGVGGVAYTLATFTEYMVAGELQGTLRRRRMQQTIDRLSGHFIICGFGRVGRQVAAELMRCQMVVIVIDINPMEEEECTRCGYHFLEGDASDDAVLVQAGITRAKGLVAVVDSDAANVYVSLSARALNPSLAIVARADQPNAEAKLRMAGANHVISPYAVGGMRMASLLVHPNVVDFLDLVMRDEELQLWLDEVQIAPESELAGKTLEEMQVRGLTGANVLGMRHEGGRVMVNWTADVRIESGGVLVALGTREQLNALANLAGHPENEH